MVFSFAVVGRWQLGCNLLRLGREQVTAALICSAVHLGMEECESPDLCFSHSDEGIEDSALPSSFFLLCYPVVLSGWVPLPEVLLWHQTYFKINTSFLGASCTPLCLEYFLLLLVFLHYNFSVVQSHTSCCWTHKATLFIHTLSVHSLSKVLSLLNVQDM